MTAQAIAEALEINVEKVNDYLDLITKLPTITTPEEAEDLYEHCPIAMEAAVVAKWTELVLPTITTPEEAEDLHRACPDEMKPAIMAKWIELVTQAISLLTTPEEAQALFQTCPEIMEPLIVEWMSTRFV